MEIRKAVFVASNDHVSKCPKPDKPEFAFIGRSNSGKSSLINMLVQRRNLAKTSQHPGKTRTINHYLIDDTWYLVDLPGYGYASVSKKVKEGWGPMIEQYLLKRENLYALFVLLDARHPLQQIDADFITWAGRAGIPLCLVLTKADKLSANALTTNRDAIRRQLLEIWEELPPFVVTSSVRKTGREELLAIISRAIAEKE
ncbi:MAG: ribosome biogenesis GTP-binding protein YihA/YsxC [Cyclobacteriaceae bacterium]|jgi:GTP-binding protein|nr:ribosome biogenesis GTP-binding protein YihA/YsxC [Cyclobacteriaceae bacterium]